MKLLIVFITALLTSLLFESNAQSYIGYLADNVELRDSSGQKITKKAKKGDGVLIYTLDVFDGDKYKVHHINSAKDGYIFRKDVLLEKSVPYTAQTMDEIKQAIRDTEMRLPVLKLYNNTKDKLSLKFGKEEIVLKPQERTSMRMDKGKYYYKLRMPGFDPYYGVEILEEHKLYDWEFYVGK